MENVFVLHYCNENFIRIFTSIEIASDAAFEYLEDLVRLGEIDSDEFFKYVKELNTSASEEFLEDGFCVEGQLWCEKVKLEDYA